MVGSLAIGLGLDENLDEDKKNSQKFFYGIDTNPDGCLTKDELSRAVKVFISNNEE